MNLFARVFAAVNGLAIVGIRVAYLVRFRNSGRRARILSERSLLILQAVGLSAGSVAVALFVLLPSSLGASYLGFPLWLRYSGALLGASAAALLGWSHHSLGAGFSPFLGIRKAHRLVRTGPYGLIRHPMYAAFILQVIGFFLLTASWVVAAAWSPMVVSIILRMDREEEMMIREFGDGYRGYRRRTGRLLPHLPWGRKPRS